LDAFPPPVQEHFPKLVDAIKQHLSENQEDRTQQTKVADDESAITPVQGLITDYEWHDIDKKYLSPWASKRIKELDSGKQIRGKTFLYRRNRYTGKYQRKLKPQM
jgi:hypothetical protein